jgi:hypothetical protein
MEGLAIIVMVLFTLAMICGPIAIALARIKTKSLITTFIKRIFHGMFITLGTLVGAQWLLIPGLPIAPRFFGLTSLFTCYIAVRNEYFPSFKILERLGIKPRNKSAHGPAMKWKLGGRSNGKDGHGPEGQH